MTTIIIALHLVVSLALIVIILLQTGSGAGMGAAFGAGSSQTLFGSSGSSKFFTRLTAGAAALFMITSLSLTIISAHRAKGTLMEGFQEMRPAVEAPVAAPAAEPAAAEPAAPVESAPMEQSAVPDGAAPAAEPAAAEPAAPAGGGEPAAR
ncbi:MAG: preprotein translocase subunit SecG [Deltaproteobacteria bacterium]|nr:preprotein translocase subunit SecG [Candidatus Anaeroferrophillacea bacterium]